MITHDAITEFLSRLPADASRDGGIKEDMYDMLVGARNALQQRSVLPPPQYAIYGADRNDAYAKGFCGGVEATVEFNRDTKEARDILRQMNADAKVERQKRGPRVHPRIAEVKRKERCDP